MNEVGRSAASSWGWSNGREPDAPFHQPPSRRDSHFASASLLPRGLSARLIGGRRFWIARFSLCCGLPCRRCSCFWAGTSSVSEALNVTVNLVGLPMVVLAIGLGVRVIAGEMDRRTLEIAYTVPGGAHRCRLGKLLAASALLALSGSFLALAAFLFFTPYPVTALYPSMQAALFYLVLSMGLGALFRSEITGAFAAAAALFLNGLISAFGEQEVRLSPFFNPLALTGTNPSDVLAWTIQNRIGFALVIAALLALAFSRAERREKLLGG